METQIAQTYGFWALLAWVVIRDGAIPLLRRYVPIASRRSDREQDRADKIVDFEQQMKLRQTEAFEDIARMANKMDGRLSRVENDVTIIKNDVQEIRHNVVKSRKQKTPH